MPLRKLPVVSVVALIVIAVSATAAERPVASTKRVDQYGDALPEGAVMRLGTLRGRTGPANLVISADGKSINTIIGKHHRVWDADTGALRQTRELPEALRDYHAVSLDGRLLVLPDASIVDLSSGKAICTLITEKGAWPYCAAFSPDGKQVAAVLERREENIVAVWSVATGERIFTRKISNQVFGSQLIFSPDGKRLLAPLTDHEGGMRCWDIPAGRLLWENKELGSYSLVITPDSKVLSAQPSNSVVDLATGRPIAFKQMPPVGWSNRLTLTPDGRTLLLADGNGVRDVVVWDLVQGKEVRRLERAGDLVVVAPDGKSIITSNGALQRWDLTTGKPLFPHTFAWGHARDVVALAFSADGTRLASTSTDGTVRLWDTMTGRSLRVWSGHRGWNPCDDRGHWQQNWKAGAEAVDITPDGRYVLSGGGDEYLRLWDATTDREVRSIALPEREEGTSERQFHCLRISPDGARAIALFGSRYAVFSNFGSRITNKLAVWNLKTGQMFQCHKVKESEAWNSAISSDGLTLLVNGVLMDMATGKEIGRLQGGERGNACAFSHDGALAVGGSTWLKENTFVPDGVRIWEVATGKTIAHLQKKSWIARVCFHPDNGFVAVNEADGIRVWDVRSGKVAVHLKKQEVVPGSEPIDRYGNCLAFAPDGRRLATGHADSTMMLWDVPPPASKHEPLAAKELESLWTDLADADAAKAWQAVWRLSDAPNEVLPLLRDRLHAIRTISVDAMQKLAADLDAESFARREAAEKRLKELGRLAEPALRAALRAKPSLEQQRRIEELLSALPETPPPPSAEELRQLRALIVLERIGTPEARRVLEDVAKGPQSARLTRQALAVLACMR